MPQSLLIDFHLIQKNDEKQSPVRLKEQNIHLQGVSPNINYVTISTILEIRRFQQEIFMGCNEKPKDLRKDLFFHWSPVSVIQLWKNRTYRIFQLIVAF